MNTVAENITFMIVRGIVALAIVGVGAYCLAQGIHFFALPRVEAEQIRINLVGLDITASGLGAVIFATGLALCYVGKRTAPTSIQTTRTTETVANQGTTIQTAESSATQDRTPTAPLTGAGSVRTTEGVAIMKGKPSPRARLD